jgi:hypothetical protein
LRFYRTRPETGGHVCRRFVSTLLEILLIVRRSALSAGGSGVSTLLEILRRVFKKAPKSEVFLFQPFLRFYGGTTPTPLRSCSAQVSTLLEILQHCCTSRLEAVAKNWSFQPFLRFYTTVRRGIYNFSLWTGEFQPFLRFYRISERMVLVIMPVSFQPFLRFYTESSKTLHTSSNKSSVSTLLEILPLMCLVVVGF